MTSSRASLLLLLAGCGLSLSCKQGAASDCSAYHGETQVRYVGNAIGWGKLTLEASDDDDAPLRASLELEDESGTGANFRLAGVGTCRDGILRLRIAGFATPTEGLEILGGSIVAVVDHELENGLFGSWRVEVQGANFDGRRELNGFLREEHERWVSVSASPAEPPAGTGPS